ncbi:efflux transporter outer membrane subunit [Duganella sp. LX20W]|uniref:Efflux transporter outer membrane subunit n=1 Tax=Rugamonas brunnea TaxID=2758569 RepID=A0A7W2EN67_9BURK|nr:efflux transporter outer membrane subunit [Rugamonas brunnea]MBA5635527.1 efflux transporter outer membrane subunit [Rugamonas brunnea]
MTTNNRRHRRPAPTLTPTAPALATRAPRALLALLSLAVAGCAHIPQDSAPLPQRDVAGASLAADIRLAHDGWPAARWWTGYGDPQLDALMAQALASAPSLEVAAAHIGSAHAALDTSSAALGVELDGHADVNRQRYSGTGLFPAPIGGSYFTEENVRLEARYHFDWWGKNRAQIAAAVGDLNAQRASYAQAEQALAAAIAQTYFRLQGTWARLDNTNGQIAIQTALVQDQAKRMAHGLATSDSAHAAEAELAQLRKQQAQLQADAGAAREALRALLGADASALTGLKPRALTATPHALPAQLGMELLARRPDLQAARWQVQAALSQTEAVQAAFYPDINLSAAIGLDSISYQHLLQSASRTLYLAPTLNLPLFDSKRLNAQLASARSQRDEKIAAYNQAVVQAVREVAQDSLALQGMEQQLARQQEATQAANAQLRSVQARAAHGLADRRSELSAQLALLRQQDSALALTHAQVQAEVALTQALGGGYRNEAASAAANEGTNAAVNAAATTH